MGFPASVATARWSESVCNGCSVFRIRAAVDAIIITCWIILNAICVAAVLQGVRIASDMCVTPELPDAFGWVFIVSGMRLHHELLHRLRRDADNAPATDAISIPTPSVKAAPAGLDRFLLGVVGYLRHQMVSSRPVFPWSYRT